LLHRFDKLRSYYYAFTITNQGVVYFYKKDKDGYNVAHTGRSKLFVANNPNKLAVIGKGSSLHLCINDSLKKYIEGDELKLGDSGIIGIGIGRHCFDNFTISKDIDKLPI
jgi:hypothetical protein